MRRVEFGVFSVLHVGIRRRSPNRRPGNGQYIIVPITIRTNNRKKLCFIIIRFKSNTKRIVRNVFVNILIYYTK